MSGRDEQDGRGQLLKRALRIIDELETKLDASERSAREPIAVVGMGCRFPGANGPGALWTLLRDGVDAISTVPGDRWDVASIHATAPGTPGKTTSRWGGFLDDVRGFDARFFGISPREAERMDPQHRLLLEVSWEALEHAGVAPDRLAGTPGGVYLGIIASDYAALQAEAAGDACFDLHYTTGSSLNAAAGRISHQLGLTGPSVAIDSACSSSLVAVHQACLGLRARDCDLALAGGVSVLLSSRWSIALSQANALSADGRCKAFDASADGFVRSEGCGVLVLKRLSDARAAGDPILAIVASSAVNQDGRSSGLTVPNGLAQQAVIRKALERASLTPQDIDGIEAHGTGTSLGDPIEARALGEVFGPGRSDAQPLVLGSVKTNLGHTEAAAGVAGMMKVILALQHEQFPPHLHLKARSPRIDWTQLPAVLPDTLRSWPAGSRKRRAGVSSFGISGTNAHVILEEAPEAPAQVDVPASGLALPTGEAAEQLFLLSARSHEALRALARAHVDRLDDDGALALVPLLSLCAAAATRRSHHLHRIAITAHDRLSLRDKLLAFLHDEPRQGLSHAHQPHSRTARLVFVFPGQGAQWLGMGRQLFAHQPVFRDALRRCADAFAPFVDWSLEHALLHGDAPLLDRIDVLQPLLFAFQFALASLWRAWGLRPDALLGHSMGEVAAAAFSGALSLSDAARVICRRSALLRSLHGTGAMAVVDLSHDDLRPILADRFPLLDLAASNAPRSSVVAGEPLPLQQLIDSLQAQGVYCRLVRVDVASHSRHVDPLLPRLLDALQGLLPRTASLPILSSVSAAHLDGTEMGPDYWARNLRQPVLFSQAVRRLLDDGPCRFLEIAPHPGLLHAIAQSFLALDAEPAAVASLRRDDSERAAMLDALGALYTLGHDLDVHALFPGTAPLPALPTYPFQHDAFWFQQTPHAAPALRSMTTPHAQGQHHPLLGAHLASSVHRGTHFWHLDALSLGSLPWLDHHRLHGHPVLPAAAFLDLALSAAASLGHTGSRLSQVSFRAPLFLQGQATRAFQIALLPNSTQEFTFQVSSRAAEESDAPWTLHAEGRVHPGEEDSTRAPDSLDALRARCTTEVSVEEHDAALKRRGLQFGPSFRCVEQIWLGQREVLGRVRLPDSLDAPQNHRIHPALLDACFQLLGAVVASGNGHEGGGETVLYLPAQVGALRVYGRAAPRAGWCHMKVEQEKNLPERMTGEIFLRDDQGRVLVHVRGFVVQRLEAAVAPTTRRSREPREALLALRSGQARRQNLETRVRAELAAVLKLSPSRIDRLVPVAELGIDSVMALECRNRLQQAFDIPLSATLLWVHPTIAALATHLAGEMNISFEDQNETSPREDALGAAGPRHDSISTAHARAASPAAASSVMTRSLTQFVREVETLSEEEVLAALLGVQGGA
ncbi:type I polyketide synthase [Chondromyces crocatus]|uniref:Polyketide synthase n=1 Tax=Chondromyces crocatus TaxID=52 RepID=B9ZUJ8_CHOCO|nr:type I polyketide synthase [Chondromyces crocatus]AKT41166.1 uncharacterized protein CMC5_053270 [Chondromyces crocatus]CAQ43077.1 polyketide synthase [Chondromyces crocatus]